jgi:hypothetical protein
METFCFDFSITHILAFSQPIELILSVCGDNGSV